jgi:hypothetical protein
MARLRDHRDLDSPAHAAADGARAGAGRTALTDVLPVQRKAAGAAPPELGFAPPRAATDDPFGLHLGAAPVQMQATTTTAGTSKNGAEERARVAETTTFLKEAVTHLGVVKKPSAATIERMLQGWQDAVVVARSLIETTLNNDPTLLKDLREAYVKAVTTARSKHPQGKNPTFISDHKAVIDHWAWTVSRENDANELIDALPEAERQKLKVVTASSAKMPPLAFSGDEITDWTDPGTSEAQLGGTTITHASTVDASWRHTLENVVGKLTAGTGAQPLLKNTTMTLQIDLRPHGGPLGTFRFTYVDRARADEILVELVGRSEAEGMSKGKTEKAEEKFTANGFTRSGYSGHELEELLHAILIVPDAALALVNGVTFRRASVHPSNPAAGGEYDEAAHTITMYDKAFRASVPSVGTRTLDQLGARNVGRDGEVSDESSRLIAHEIGHAINYVPVKKAGGSSRVKRESDTDERRATDEFIDAVRADGGVAITEYAATAKGEHYAEAFSFYASDPLLLQSLRPNVYAFFARKFP